MLVYMDVCAFLSGVLPSAHAHPAHATPPPYLALTQHPTSFALPNSVSLHSWRFLSDISFAPGDFDGISVLLLRSLLHLHSLAIPWPSFRSPRLSALQIPFELSPDISYPSPTSSSAIPIPGRAHLQVSCHRPRPAFLIPGSVSTIPPLRASL
ncbi:hypothetical protein C8F04DRAFT_1261741 [Mycena alexandri]|uniref:Uncharacterized protein n=1 Tax=Mycena alexandri TaxID=1745969 RepID=A0AAD6SUI6_9AGAR|nr:hypothetical protein C8F04DRAFT_1261741 [Mycena alexandri]